MHLPPLETTRLVIRPFSPDDLDAAHRLLDVECADVDFGTAGTQSRAERERWLTWTVLNYEELAKLFQPPYGDRAVVLKQSGAMIGSIGLVPCLAAFGLLPGFAPSRSDAPSRATSAEVGLFYAISRAHQGQGYATEAARALADFAFQKLELGRLVATTTYDNTASMAVMRKLGMRIEQNPFPEPPWLQVVGVLERDKLRE
jgi:[ribosomal protein S5]-alanine N-acetyltransferase